MTNKRPHFLPPPRPHEEGHNHQDLVASMMFDVIKRIQQDVTISTSGAGLLALPIAKLHPNSGRCEAPAGLVDFQLTRSINLSSSVIKFCFSAALRNEA